MLKFYKTISILAVIILTATTITWPAQEFSLRQRAALDRDVFVEFYESKTFATDKVERLALPGVEQGVVRALLAEYERMQPGEAGQKKADLSTPDEINEVEEHALCVAAIASRLLAIEEGIPLDSDEAKRMFIIGLLHDVGRAGFDPVTTQKIIAVIRAYNETTPPHKQIPLQREEFMELYPRIAPENIQREVIKMARPVLESAGMQMTGRAKFNLGLILDHEWRSAAIVENRAGRINKIIKSSGVTLDADMLEVIKFHYDPRQYLRSLGYNNAREVRDEKVLRNFRLLQIIAAADSFAGRNSRKKGRIYYKQPHESLLRYAFTDTTGASREVEGAFTRLKRYGREGMISTVEYDTMVDLTLAGTLDDVIAVARDITPDQQAVFVKTQLAQEKDVLAKQENCTRLGIDKNWYREAVTKISEAKQEDSKRRLDLLKKTIRRRVANRSGKAVSGKKAVDEVEWLLGQLIKRSNCSDKLFEANMPDHMKEMRGMAEKLTAELGIRASAELLIAAMLHDADRFFDGYYIIMKDEPRTTNPRYRNYYKPIQHPRMAADFVRPLLELLGINKRIVRKADLLIRNHETGIRGNRDSNLLRDADAISVFTPVLLINILVLENEGRPDRLSIEVTAKYNRCSPESRRVIDKLMAERENEYRATQEGNTAYEVFLRVKSESTITTFAPLDKSAILAAEQAILRPQATLDREVLKTASPEVQIGYLILQDSKIKVKVCMQSIGRNVYFTLYTEEDNGIGYIKLQKRLPYSNLHLAKVRIHPEFAGRGFSYVLFDAFFEALRQGILVPEFSFKNDTTLSGNAVHPFVVKTIMRYGFVKSAQPDKYVISVAMGTKAPNEPTLYLYMAANLREMPLWKS